MGDYNTEQTENTPKAGEAINSEVLNRKKIEDMNVHIQSVLQQMKDKFQTMSDQIMTKIDDMGSRIDDLEKNITDLMSNAGFENPDK